MNENGHTYNNYMSFFPWSLLLLHIKHFILLAGGVMQNSKLFGVQANKRTNTYIYGSHPFLKRPVNLTSSGKPLFSSPNERRDTGRLAWHKMILCKLHILICNYNTKW